MSRALLKFVRVSPTKARLIAREVQGMNAELALAALEFMPNKAAGIVSKVIASAVANGDYEPEEVIITSCRVDKAAVMKRWRPRARGTASRIIKPTAHILVEVGTVSSETEAPAKKSVNKKSAAKKETAKKETVKKEVAKKTSAKAVETKETTKKEAPKTAAKADVKGDDLTKIKGIGKVYAGKLNDEGIFTYQDVANMTNEQIAMMEEKYTFKGDFRDSVADAKNFVNGKDA
jgi:large subunit ribosomal protein L22